jgi:hypothetical protein
MGLGTKNRQRQTAETCKRHLRQKYHNRGDLVEEFISEVEGTGKNAELTRWGRFTDSSHIEKEMLHRLDGAFEKWLNPSD